MSILYYYLLLYDILIFFLFLFNLFMQKHDDIIHLFFDFDILLKKAFLYQISLLLYYINAKFLIIHLDLILFIRHLLPIHKIIITSIFIYNNIINNLFRNLNLSIYYKIICRINSKIYYLY